MVRLEEVEEGRMVGNEGLIALVGIVGAEIVAGVAPFWGQDLLEGDGIGP